MTFNPENLNKLRELARQLPKKLPTPKTSPNSNTKNKLHKVETEEDPEKLFKALIDISPNGTVPPHLIERLKSLETTVSKVKSSQRQSTSNFSQDKLSNKAEETSTEINSLYNTFQYLLLEEES